MSTITRGNAPRLLQEGVKKVFGNTYEQWPEQYGFIFDKESSRKAFEIDVQLEGFDLAQEKEEGGGIAFDARRQGFTPTYTHITTALGYTVTKEAYDDELYGQFKKGAKQLARSMRIKKERVAADILNNGFDANFVQPGGDGLSLFNTAHINGPTNSNTYSNQLAVAAALSEASLEDLIIQVRRAKDPRDLEIQLRAVRLIVPPELQFEAQRILGSVLQNDTANNATNAMRDMRSISDGFVVNDYLTSASNWFIKTDAPDGLKCYQRQEVDFGEDMAFTTGNYRFKATERYSFGWSDPRGVYASGS